MHLIRSIRQTLPLWGTLFALAALFLTAAPAPAQGPLTKVSFEVNKKMCKLFGAGGFKGHGHVVTAMGTPMSNLLLLLANNADVPIDSFGDSTGVLNLDAPAAAAVPAPTA